MSVWTDHLANPQAVLSLYEQAPSLETFELVEVALDREGPSLSIRGNLDSFPTRRSSRWPADANRLQLSLRLFGIRELVMSGWSHDNVGEVRLSKRSSDEVAFEFLSPNARLQCIALRVQVEGVAAYVAE